MIKYIAVTHQHDVEQVICPQSITFDLFPQINVLKALTFNGHHNSSANGRKNSSEKNINVLLVCSTCRYRCSSSKGCCEIACNCPQSLVTWETENKMTCRQTLLDGNVPKTHWTRELRGNELILVRSFSIT